jgi:hypothetical protein
MSNVASLTWHTKKDGHQICPICLAIDGYTWTFADTVPDSLIHPTYGEVWNAQLGSLAHEHQLHKGSKYGVFAECQCSVEGKLVSLVALASSVSRLKDRLKTETGGSTK